jgi:hypothetical protein
MIPEFLLIYGSGQGASTWIQSRKQSLCTYYIITKVNYGSKISNRDPANQDSLRRLQWLRWTHALCGFSRERLMLCFHQTIRRLVSSSWDPINLLKPRIWKEAVHNDTLERRGRDTSPGRRWKSWLLAGSGTPSFGISVRLFLGLLFSLLTEDVNTQVREVTLWSIECWCVSWSSVTKRGWRKLIDLAEAAVVGISQTNQPTRHLSHLDTF